MMIDELVMRRPVAGFWCGLLEPEVWSWALAPMLRNLASEGMRRFRAGVVEAVRCAVLAAALALCEDGVKQAAMVYRFTGSGGAA